MEIGTLRIGLSDVILDEYLMPYIVKFREMYPNINLIIYTSNEDIYKKYNLGLIDIFFNNMPTDLPNQGVFEEVKTLTNCFVASEKFKDYKNKKLDYKALEELPLLVLNKGSINRNRLDDFCYKHKIKLNCKMEFSSNNLVKKFTLNGFGIGMLDEEYVKEELKNKKLFKLDIDVPLDRKFLIMFYNEHNQNLALKKFIDLIREEQ
jgi:DNA-binding transcriptional LysR family regulator